MNNDQVIEFAKCARSPIYYLNTYGNVFNARERRITLMKCFKYQKDVLRKFHNFRNNIILKSRQTGLSVVTAGYVAWRLLFSRDERILIIANDGAGAVRFLKTVKQFIEMTPGFLKPDFTITDNTKKIEFSNGCWAEAKASSPDAGRGESLTMLILDETAFIKDMEDIWMGAGMALSATQGKCIMISTPNGTGSLYHRTWVQGEKANGNNPEDFICSKVHWTENPFSSIGLTTKKDSDGIDVHWSPWYEEQCKRLTWDSVKIAQELDLSFEGSKRLAIDSVLVNKYEKKVRNIKPLFSLEFDFLNKDDPIKFTKINGSMNECLVWKVPESKKHYIVGGDVARGDGQDYSTIQIIEVESMEQVCEFQGKVGPDLFPYIINHLARWYNEAYVSIEANSFGLGVCFDMRDKFKYKRLHYSKNIQDIHVRSARDYKVEEGISIPGFQTTRKTRPAIIKAIIEHMREGSLVLNSKRLINEFTTFVMNGEKPEHENGFHDDLIFALGIALYMRDTEYNNVTASNAMYKSMLEAMSFGTSSSVGEVKETPEHVKKYEESKKADFPPGIGGIMFDVGNRPQVDDDNDDSWLMGPIKG